jgi:hypothetical protein
MGPGRQRTKGGARIETQSTGQRIYTAECRSRRVKRGATGVIAEQMGREKWVRLLATGSSVVQETAMQ